MYTRLFGCALLCLASGAAFADGVGVPGLGPQAFPATRPGYRHAYNHYPPPRHDMFGRPVPPPSPLDRPSYRESYSDFPPVEGRYGGGFIEFLLTGGRPQAVAAGAASASSASQAPSSAYRAYAAPAVGPVTQNPAAAILPKSDLPDFAPQPPAYYGRPSAQNAAYAAPRMASNAPGASYGLVAADPGAATQPMSPIFYRQQVAYSGRERPGTIVIDTPNKFLYLVKGGGEAIRYGIGVGRPGFAWAGVKSITRKAEWPGWTPPRQMLARRPDLPRHMDGGEANPLGARALYLGSSLYRIHGTNEPYTIGTNVSSGCIRMMNQDVIDLYGRVGVGTRVIVL